jgi:DNA-binding response OmpR family regulator
MAKKVLIVDDEPNIVVSLEFLLRQSGYEVHVAADGEAALRQVQAVAPDLVLLDVMMPEKNGYDVCRRIRARPEWSKIRIVFLSAKGREAEMTKGLSLGADAYVTKPFSNAELVARIGELLQERTSPGGA